MITNIFIIVSYLSPPAAVGEFYFNLQQRAIVQNRGGGGGLNSAHMCVEWSIWSKRTLFLFNEHNLKILLYVSNNVLELFDPTQKRF